MTDGWKRLFAPCVFAVALHVAGAVCLAVILQGAEARRPPAYLPLILVDSEDTPGIDQPNADEQSAGDVDTLEVRAADPPPVVKAKEPDVIRKPETSPVGEAKKEALSVPQPAPAAAKPDIAPVAAAPCAPQLVAKLEASPTGGTASSQPVGSGSASAERGSSLTKAEAASGGVQSPASRGRGGSGISHGPSPIGEIHVQYPIGARRRGEEGCTTLRVDVGVEGNVLGAAVLASSGYPVLDDAALRGARKSRFMAGSIGGTPCATDTVVAIRFRLVD